MARKSRKRNDKRNERGEERKVQSTSSVNRTQLIRDAGSIPFTWPTGNAISFVPDVVWDHQQNPTLYPILGPSVKKWNLPGVTALYTVPTLGRAIDANDPATVSSRSVYGFVRHANSGHANYDPPDLMMYMMGMDSIYSMYAWMTRLYGVLRNYSQVNKYTPEVIVQAMGCDYNSLESHISDLRSYINRFAAKASSLCVPNVFKYFQDHIDLYSRVFMDSRTVRGQFYIYNPDCLLKFVETEGKGKLILTSLLRKTITYEVLVEFADDLLNAMVESEDCGIISGDLLKAYGDSSLIKLSMIAEDYTVVPEYDELILNNIANTVIAGLNITSGQDWITQTDNGVVQCKPPIYTTAAPYFKSATMLALPKFIRSMLELPDPGQVVDFTRHTVGTTHMYENGNYILDVVGSEVVNRAEVFFYGWSVSSESTLDMSYGLQHIIFDNYVDVGVAQTREQTQMNAILENFAWHPLLYYYRMRPNTGEELADTWLDFVGLGGDVDNYAIANNDTLKKIHDARIMEQLSVPLLGV